MLSVRLASILRRAGGSGRGELVMTVRILSPAERAAATSCLKSVADKVRRRAKSHGNTPNEPPNPATSLHSSIFNSGPRGQVEGFEHKDTMQRTEMGHCREHLNGSGRGVIMLHFLLRKSEIARRTYSNNRRLKENFLRGELCNVRRFETISRTLFSRPNETIACRRIA